MMLRILATIFVTTSLTLVNAAPRAVNNELDTRFSPSHSFGNALNARYAKHHVNRSTVLKKSHRMRRSCLASSSVNSGANSTTASPTNSPVDTPFNTPTDASSSPADTPAPYDPQPTTSADSGSSNDNTPTSAPSGDIQTYLDMHNNERANHGADALTWADDLAGVAQSWANNCVWKHSGGQYGENLSTGNNLSPSGAVQLWLNEAPQYDPSNPQYSHWTQVVWKGTQEVGCAVTTCSGEAMLGTNADGPSQFYVCEYRPAGNVIGEFAQNVQA